MIEMGNTPRIGLLEAIQRLSSFRENLITSSPKPSGDIFSPRNFDEYIGQTEAKELVQIMLGAAIKEQRRLPNSVIVGEYGLGKTTLAKLLCEAFGQPFKLTDGATLNKELPTSGLIIVDEIHLLSPDVCDTLNVILDQNNLTLVGCTTDSGKLPSAFRSRFRTFYLHPYSENELTTILRHAVERKGTTVTKLTLETIASRARSNARTALHYLAFMFDLMVVQNHTTLTKPLVHEGFLKLGIDAYGFSERDRMILSAIPDDRAVGLQFIAAVTGIDEKTIENEMEPFLMRKGYVDRTSRGRVKLRDILE